MTQLEAFIKASVIDKEFRAGKLATSYMYSTAEGNRWSHIRETAGMMLHKRGVKTHWYMKAFLDGTIIVHEYKMYDLQRRIRYDIEHYLASIATEISTHSHIKTMRRKPLIGNPEATDFFEHIQGKYELTNA